jgi:hypothetical protein
MPMPCGGFAPFVQHSFLIGSSSRTWLLFLHFLNLFHKFSQPQISQANTHVNVTDDNTSARPGE